ncbi:MAG TPA: choice-of-anchor V domain-containing protein [Bacteroidia bacterium]|nr:choice-of-anchor V domain-containing protein [Bacteroidia bacterium]
MKTKPIVLLLLFSAITMSFILSDNGRAGVTGSPGETTCNTSSCHVGNPVNSANGSIEIVAPTMTNWQYTPGQVYPISVTVSQTGRSLFGLGFESLQSSGANGGALTISNATQTQLKNAVIGGNLRTSVVHKLNGGASANTHTFTFNWTAPASTVGNVTFYAAGNAANGNGSESGDYIYTVNQLVVPVTSGIVENEASSVFATYPNPVTDELHVDYFLADKSGIQIQLYTLEGKLVSALFDGVQDKGKHTETFSTNSNYTSGVYLLRFSNGTSDHYKKILIQ